MQALVGSITGSHQIQGHQARSGMTDIYLATHTQTGESVTIKMVHTKARNYCGRFPPGRKSNSIAASSTYSPSFCIGKEGKRSPFYLHRIDASYYKEGAEESGRAGR